MKEEGSKNNGKLQGLLAEFESPEQLVAAARRVRAAGYTKWEAYSPFPVHGLDDAMGARRPPLQLLTIAGGAAGAAAGLLMQWWMVAVDYPFILSGKLPFSLPAFIPVMFETTILFGALGTFSGMLLFAGLPKLYHALHTSRRFSRASADRFFINIEAADPEYDAAGTTAFLEEIGGAGIEEIREAD